MSVKVKPLVWVSDATGYAAKSGRYFVEFLSHGQYLLNVDYQMVGGVHEGMDAAKRAAFEHHEDFVLSALEASE